MYTAQASPAVNLLYPGIAGAVVSNNATTPNTKVDVSAGIMRDQSDTFDINLGNVGGVYANVTANATTTIDTSVVGLNGIDTGVLQASKVYYIYAIADYRGFYLPGAIASLAAPSVGPLLPENYNIYRWVGFKVTDASVHFLPDYQYGEGNWRVFAFDAPQATAITAGNATSFTAVALTALVPAISNLPVMLATAFTPGAASRTLDLSPYGATGVAARITGQVTSVVVTTNSQVLARLNSGAPSVYYKVSNSGDAAAINVAGFSFTV